MYGNQDCNRVCATYRPPPYRNKYGIDRPQSFEPVTVDPLLLVLQLRTEAEPPRSGPSRSAQKGIRTDAEDILSPGLTWYSHLLALAVGLAPGILLVQSGGDAMVGAPRRIERKEWH